MHRSDGLVDINLDDSGDEHDSLANKLRQKRTYATFNLAEESTTSWLWQSVKSTLPSWESMKYYLPSYQRLQTLFTTLLYTGPLFLVSMGSVGPLLPYTFGFPTGTPPRDFSMDWFVELSLYYQAASIINTLVFWGAETLVRYDHFNGLLGRLADILKKCCSSITDMISVASILFFSGTAGIAAGGLGYDSYKWYPSLAPYSGITNGIVVCAFRIEFMSSFFNTIKKKFDEDAQFQQTIIQLLKRLKNEGTEEFETLFSEDEINTDTARLFLHALLDRALENDYFYDPTTSENVRHYLGQTTDVAISSLYASAFGAFFAVNGYIGLEILCELVSSECGMDTLLQHEQTIIAVITGISSGILGFMTGLKLRDIIQTTYEHIKEHPYDIIKLVAILVLCGTAQSSIWNASQDILGRDNIFGLTQGLVGTLFAMVNTALVGTFCFDSLYRMLMKKNDHSFCIKNFTDWLKENELPKETIASLREHSFFSKKTDSREENMPVLGIKLASV